MEAIPAFDPLSSGMAAKYLIALYKGINALTNLGYEGVRPVNAVEMVLSISVMFVQIFVMAYILGDALRPLSVGEERRVSPPCAFFFTGARRFHLWPLPGDSPGRGAVRAQEPSSTTWWPRMRLWKRTRRSLR